MTCSYSGPEWYALLVRPRSEKTVSELLKQKGYEDFLPLSSETHKWSDRFKVLKLPLFPRYLFCRFDLREKVQVLRTQCVQRIVGFGGEPQPVPEEEISSLRKLLESGLHPQTCEYLSNGQTVVVREGPLAGLRGSIIRTKGNCRVVLSIHLLQRSVYAEVHGAAVVATME